MIRLNDEKFLETKPNPDSVIGIRIKDGDIYFLAWMEDAPHYRIQQAADSDGYLLDRSKLTIDGDIYSCITETSQYNFMHLLYELDNDGNLINEDDKEYECEYEMFLSLINPYERNGEVHEGDHDILSLTQQELCAIVDMLRDGDYVLVIEDMYS